MARSDRYAAKAGAWADFRLASLTDQATAVATLATTIDTPWAHFQADLAAARRDWWSGVKPDYLAWVADVNQEYEDYQAAAGNAYVTQVGNVTAASTARWNHVDATLLTRRTYSRLANDIMITRPDYIDYEGMARAIQGLYDEMHSIALLLREGRLSGEEADQRIKDIERRYRQVLIRAANQPQLPPHLRREFY